MIRVPDVGSSLGTVTVASAAAELWYAMVGDHTADVERFGREYLSDDERAHLMVYRGRGAAERYVVTRALVRVVLAQRLGTGARNVRIRRTLSGKPVVSEGLRFNVSHSGDLILLAVSEQHDVGVDVERRRRVERVVALVDRWLTPAEQSELGRLTTDGRDVSDAFLQVWSLKEARLKALGIGIAGASGAAVDAVRAVPLDATLAAIRHARDERGYVGALAFA